MKDFMMAVLPLLCMAIAVALLFALRGKKKNETEILLLGVPPLVIKAMSPKGSTFHSTYFDLAFISSAVLRKPHDSPTQSHKHSLRVTAMLHQYFPRDGYNHILLQKYCTERVYWSFHIQQ